jgi:ketosteroid isomerase-like protein
MGAVALVARVPERNTARAMSQENVKTVRDAFVAFNRGDLDAFEQYWTDDIDYRAAEGALDDHGPIQGKDALRAFMQDWLDMFDDFRAEPVDLIEAGEDKVIAVVRISGRAKLSGVETDLTYAELWTLRDGKVAWGRQYWTRDEALEAAGLSE